MECNAESPTIKTKLVLNVYNSCNVTNESAKNIPNFFEGAKSQEWLEAMKNEISVIEKNQTWELTELSTDKCVICVKWVFRTKLNPNDTVFKRVLTRND